ncbi:unnamed protein product [Lupinus luteus]|uniref:Uncharacterized protein n=1 Tax=Lupinus luteus TaxID=3873 RepID=A0AAV1XDE2_LUPLU
MHINSSKKNQSSTHNCEEVGLNAFASIISVPQSTGNHSSLVDSRLQGDGRKAGDMDKMAKGKETMDFEGTQSNNHFHTSTFDKGGRGASTLNYHGEMDITLDSSIGNVEDNVHGNGGHVALGKNIGSNSSIELDKDNNITTMVMH